MRFLLRALTLALLVTASVAATGLSPAPAGAAGELPDLLPLHAVRGAAPGIVDAAGRQVVLRGVNLNTLGDYYQANPNLPTTYPYQDTDFAEMASYGFDVVRLIVSWSRLEPSRGTIDAAYLAQIHHAVDAARAQGIYTVIDLHQDAWGKFIASPPALVCGPGLSPSIGWDGAPEWATITDGADTCHGTSREDSEAVRTAWDHFYADTHGIQSELVGVWGRVASEFAHDPAVAGYDLLNEPNVGHPGTTDAPVALGAFYGRAIGAIRAAEAAAGPGALSHLALFETTIYGQPVPVDFTADTNIAFAPHNYAESFLPVVTIEQVYAYFGSLAATYGVALWTGEYGWFGDPPANKPKVVRFGQAEDAGAPIVSGSTWWQWVQACGDPHSGGNPAPVLTHFHTSTCPGDVLTGVPEAWSTVVSRPLVRAAPGRIASLASDGDAATLHLQGDPAGAVPGAGSGATLDLWVPDHRALAGGADAAVLGITAPVVRGSGIADVRLVAAVGGWRVFAAVCAPYDVRIGTDDHSAPVPAAACPAAPTTTLPPSAAPGAAVAPAAPVAATPAFTG
jgi:endoglycosylceramidase